MLMAVSAVSESIRPQAGNILKFFVVSGNAVLCSKSDPEMSVSLFPGDKVALQNQPSSIVNQYQLDGVDEADVVFVAGKGLCFSFPHHPQCAPIPIRDLFDEKLDIVVVSVTQDDEDL